MTGHTDCPRCGRHITPTRRHRHVGPDTFCRRCINQLGWHDIASECPDPVTAHTRQGATP